MKKIFGIILLILALLSAVNVANKLSHSGARATGNRAYDTGHKFGMVTAPILFGAIGLWLLLSARRAGEQSSAVDRKKLKQVFTWLGIGAAGILVLLIAMFVLQNMKRKTVYRPPFESTTASIALHSTASNSAPVSAGPATETSVPMFSAGEKVQVRWSGKWLPGTITKINPGGFSAMVQIEDSRFPRPIVLSTKQLRKE